MAETHLSHDDFFQRLSDELFRRASQKDHGSVYLTQKRMTYGQEDTEPAEPTTSAPFPDLNPSKPLPIIIRATNGTGNRGKNRKESKIKLSTVVEVDALEAFFARYADVCKAGMSGLKKRDRSKAKEKLKAKKKKKVGPGGAEEVKKA